MATVKLDRVNKFYGQVQALFDVSLDIGDGAFVVFVGPSGCGKSTLLRVIAGLEDTSSGSVKIGERDVTAAAPADRGVSMVFQSYALYPHMTVRQNMEFGMKVNGVPAGERAARIDNAARILQLNEYLDRKPGQLSGGQRQRVAIGRSFVKQPEVFLFDEPLSNLDAKLRVQMRIELEALHRQLDATMIYVTHDQVEAMTMADMIVVLNEGRVEQIGAPLELYRHPVSRFVAEFIGSPAMNVLEVDADLLLRGIDLVPDARFVGCRPEHFVICKKGDGAVDATVTARENLGGESLLYARMSQGQAIVVRIDGDDTSQAGDEIGLDIPASRLHQFNAGGMRTG